MVAVVWGGSGDGSGGGNIGGGSESKSWKAVEGRAEAGSGGLRWRELAVIDGADKLGRTIQPSR